MVSEPQAANLVSEAALCILVAGVFRRPVTTPAAFLALPHADVIHLFIHFLYCSGIADRLFMHATNRLSEKRAVDTRLSAY